MIKVIGLASALALGNSIVNKINSSDIIEQIVKDTVSLIRKYAPVDTGRLMQSIRYEKNSNFEYTIIVDVPYAIFMEYGTRFFPKGNIDATPDKPLPRTSKSGKSCYYPFIRPAIWQIFETFPEYADRLIFNIRI